ncbi:type VI secretion system lipoprotein TssJ [Aromatoleum diolicum]|uniref:Type VI secretion system lipoprotein TssJ n=1 Tax=Aromatoleum diolicum TaxID=75796 RepID=A0ABX1QHN2_9RHOO|nr:type VI secretion system lipoprotein TssJ [Aromatoleum diolicum]NMG77535.1 type VI secretion system lipoprotein TssJ [Aromatoleum diolicum]
MNRLHQKGRHSTLADLTQQQFGIFFLHFMKMPLGHRHRSTPMTLRNNTLLPFSLSGCVLLSAACITGCSTASAVQIAGAAVGAALETAGLKKADTKSDPDAPRPLNLTLAAGPLTNAGTTGSPLALVVRIYQLRSETAFSGLSYAQASDEEAEREALQNDLVAVREVTVIPGKTYRFDEMIPARVKVIGIAAQFRRPAANRWKLAFNRETSEKSGISVGFHPCAITSGTGELTNPASTANSRSLSGVRCN